MPKLFLAVLLLLAWGETVTAQSCPGFPMSPEWVECRKAVLSACAFVGKGQVAACESEVLQRYLLIQQIAQQQRRGVSPASPMSHPIKGNFTTYSGERCIYHSPGGQFYDKTKAEMCYATPADGCRWMQGFTQMRMQFGKSDGKNLFHERGIDRPSRSGSRKAR
jgi:hypothetical protein